MGFGFNMGLTKSDKGLNKQTMCQFRAGEGSVDVYAMVLPCPHPTHSTPAMLQDTKPMPVTPTACPQPILRPPILRPQCPTTPTAKG